MNYRVCLLLMCLATGCGSSGPDVMPAPQVQMQENVIVGSVDGKTIQWKGRMYSAGPQNFSRKLQVLVPGVTYDDGRYWDAEPSGNKSYNYAHWAASSAGSDVLVLDMNPKSTAKMSGDMATPQNQAIMFGTAIQTYKAMGYTHVVCIGHSVGSAELIAYVGGGGACNSLIVTGFINVAHPLPPYINQAAIEQILMAEYTVYPEFLRSQAFYGEKEGFQPEVQDWDNSMMAVPSFRARLKTGLGVFMDPKLLKPELVRIPTLLVGGDQDDLYPGTYLVEESKLWTGTRTELVLIPKTGHSINLHEARVAAWDYMRNWISKQR